MCVTHSYVLPAADQDYKAGCFSYDIQTVWHRQRKTISKCISFERHRQHHLKVVILSLNMITKQKKCGSR